MIGKALTTAVLLAALTAAPQARAAPALGVAIVIDSGIQVAHQGRGQRHWHQRPTHHQGFGGHPGFKRHHPRRHGQHWDGHVQPRRHASWTDHRHGDLGRRSHH